MYFIFLSIQLKFVSSYLTLSDLILSRINEMVK